MSEFGGSDAKVEQIGTTSSPPRDLGDLAELLDALDLPPAAAVLAHLIPEHAPDQEGTAPMDTNLATLTVAAPEPEVLVLSVAETLMVWGESHPSTRVQALAAKARSALSDLTQFRDREHAVAEGEARVKRLREQLARAEAELKSTKTGPGQVGRPSRDELAQVRTWAWANGHDISDRGMPPRHVIAAYEAATGTEITRAA